MSAIVVLERDTGRVLAALTRQFQLNLFQPANFNYSYLINDLFQRDQPAINRAQRFLPLAGLRDHHHVCPGSGVYTPRPNITAVLLHGADSVTTND
jgi:hypothetical protein